MNTHGAFTIITNDCNKILLVKRQDYPLWDLPGGKLEQNETFIECAIREAYEETGFQINVNYKIGTYLRPKFNDTQHIYHGKIIGGKATVNTSETKELKWFDKNRLPINMIPNRRKQIKDFKSNSKNISVKLKDNNILYFVKRFF